MSPAYLLDWAAMKWFKESGRLRKGSVTGVGHRLPVADTEIHGLLDCTCIGDALQPYCSAHPNLGSPALYAYVSRPRFKILLWCVGASVVVYCFCHLLVTLFHSISISALCNP